MIHTRLVLFMLLGALAGLGYNRFIGCRSGACPIWANPYISTVYGGLLGYLLGAGGR